VAFQPVPNAASASIGIRTNGVLEYNVLNFQYATEPTVGQVQTLAEIVGDWVVSDYMPTCGSDSEYVETRTRGLSHAVDVQGIHTTGAGTAGSHPFSEPNNVTKAFSLKSGLTGRNARGRMFHAGLPNDALTDPNHVTQDWVDDVLDALEALKILIEAAAWIWVIVSRNLDGVKRTTAVTYPIEAFTVVNLTTDSMRSRLPKT